MCAQSSTHSDQANNAWPLSSALYLIMRNSMEARIAKFTSALAGASIIGVGLFFVTVYIFTQISKGDFSFLQNPFIHKVLLVCILYTYSIYLLSSISGKKPKRRLLSWLFSILFHSGLLLYLGVYNQLGTKILILGYAETLMLLLSIIGISVFVNDEISKKKV